METQGYRLEYRDGDDYLIFWIPIPTMDTRVNLSATAIRTLEQAKQPIACRIVDVD